MRDDVFRQAGQFCRELHTVCSSIPSGPSFPSGPSAPSAPSGPSGPSAPSYPSPPSLPSIPSLNTDVVIVGAGAAGLATAIFARRSNSAARVVLLDGARKPGAKILVSGGGRCNVTNTVVNDKDFWGGKRTIVRQILRAFPASRALSFFNDLGVALHEEPGGKLFPDSNRARDVLDALLNGARACGVDLRAGVRVHSVSPTNGGFAVNSSAGVLRASSVVLATGGQSLPKTGSDGAGYDVASALGHTIVPRTPALAPLILESGTPYSIHPKLAGVAVNGEISVWIEG